MASRHKRTRLDEEDVEDDVGMNSNAPALTRRPRRVASRAPHHRARIDSSSTSSSATTTTTNKPSSSLQAGAFIFQLGATYESIVAQANTTLHDHVLSIDPPSLTENAAPYFTYGNAVDEYLRVVNEASKRFQPHQSAWMVGCGLNDSYSLGTVEKRPRRQSTATSENQTRSPLRFINALLRPEHIRQISAGGMVGFALSSSGEVYSWGNDDDGGLGRLRPSNLTTEIEDWDQRPRRVQGLDHVRITQIAAGNMHCLFLTADGEVYMCGMYPDSDSGRFRIVPWNSNLSPEGCNPLPVLVPLPGKAVAIYSGQSANYDYALLEDGSLYSWGFGNYGELARTRTMDLPKCQDNGTLDASRSNYLNEEDTGPQYNEKVLMQYLTPSIVPMKNCHEVLSVACGHIHVLVVARETSNGVGFVYSSGANGDGQLGIGHAANPKFMQHELKKVELLQHEDMSQVAAGEYHSLALSLDGKRLYTWGRSDKGQLGLGISVARTARGGGGTDVAFVPAPTLVTFHNRTSACVIKDIQCGGSHSMALSYEGDVYTWGYTDGKVIGATGHVAPFDQDIYIPTKLDISQISSDENGTPQRLEAIQMTGGAQVSMFLVQQRADDETVHGK